MPNKNLSRRSIVAGAAAAAVIPPSAIAATDPDPIFAAIERCRVAYDAYGQALVDKDEIETQIPAERQKWFWAVWQPNPPPGDNDDPRWIESERAFERISNNSTQTVVDLVRTKPTTPVGMLAMMKYAVACENQGDNWADLFTGFDEKSGEPVYENLQVIMLESLTAALETILSKRARS
jgi:hypothetical protein